MRRVSDLRGFMHCTSGASPIIPHQPVLSREADAAIFLELLRIFSVPSTAGG